MKQELLMDLILEASVNVSDPKVKKAIDNNEEGVLNKVRELSGNKKEMYAAEIINSKENLKNQEKLDNKIKKPNQSADSPIMDLDDIENKKYLTELDDEEDDKIIENSKEELNPMFEDRTLISESDVNDTTLDINMLEESLKMIVEEAKENGIFEENSEQEEFEDFQESFYDPRVITESIAKPYKGKRTIIRLGREARLKWLQSRSAIAYARSANDPMYIKFAKAVRIRRALLEKIKLKYRSKANKKAKMLIRNYGKPDEAIKPR